MTTATAATAADSDNDTPTHSNRTNNSPTNHPISTQPSKDIHLLSSTTGSTSSSKNNNNNNMVNLTKLLFALTIGALLGGYLGTTLLESEYHQILTRQSSQHRASLSQIQSEFRSYVSSINEERNTKMDNLEKSLQEAMNAYQEEINDVKKECSSQEKRYYQTIENTLGRNNHSLQMARDGLEFAFEKYNSVQTQLRDASNNLINIQSKYEETIQKLRRMESEYHRMERQVNQWKREVRATSEELERRDVERAECDVMHRRVSQCEKSLEEAMDNINSNGNCNDDNVCREKSSTASVEQCQEELRKERAEKEAAVERSEHISQKIITLSETHNAVLEERIAAAEESRLDADYWRAKAEMMMEKIKIRQRKEVLDLYGPGPHRAELSIHFPRTSVTQTIVLQLAPLDLMPHTIHTFLTLIEGQIYNQGTFIMNRGHVLVAGPVDTHDGENNRRLEERMYDEGFFPDGALLFSEYSEEYPHVKHTLGFNAEMGGPVFYVNMMDNSVGHGPGEDREGEPCFAEIVEGLDVIEKIRGMALADGSFDGTVYISGSRVLGAE